MTRKNVESKKGDDEMTRTYLLWMVMALVLWLLAISGCQERLTNDEWVARYKPETIQQGEAMGILQSKLKEADGKIKTMAMWDKVKLFSVLGIVGAIFAIGLGTGAVRSLGVVGILACITAISLAYINTDYPIVFAYIGGGIGISGGLMAAWLLAKAAKQYIQTSQICKTSLPEDKRKLLFGDGDKKGYIETMIQGKYATKLSKAVRNKIYGKDKKKIADIDAGKTINTKPDAAQNTVGT